MRQPAPRRADRSDDEFEQWLAEVTERADPFMAWLGVLFGLLVGYEIAVPLGDTAARWVELAGWVIWAVFLLEFGGKLWLAPRRLLFLRRHWLQALALLLPTLRLLRFLRLLRAGRALPAGRVIASSYRTAGSARRLVRSRLGYLGALSVVAALAVAELAFFFERDAEGGIFGSFGDALIWSLSTVIALQGDPVPTTRGGQLTMIAGFAFGLVIVASLAGTIGAFLVESSRDEEARP